MSSMAGRYRLLHVSKTILRSISCAKSTNRTRGQPFSVRYGSSFASTFVNPNITPNHWQVDSKMIAPQTLRRSAWNHPAKTEDLPFALKRIQFRACQDLYLSQVVGGDLDVPMDGVELDVSYIDTGFPNGAGKDFPTVLCLHGAGGNHKDLDIIIKAMAAKGARVIAPDFPGFLQALKVNRLDLLAAFSAGCYTALALAAKSGLRVDGVALLQVPGHRPYKSVKPLWLLRLVVHLMRKPSTRRKLGPLFLAAAKAMGLPNVSDPETAFIMAQVATGIPFRNFGRVAAELPFLRLPLAITFSEDDTFMDPKISFEFADLVGLPRERLTIIDPQGRVEKPGNPVDTTDNYVKGVVFRRGGHFAQRNEKTAPVMVQTVSDLYDRIHRNRAIHGTVYPSPRAFEPDFSSIRPVRRR